MNHCKRNGYALLIVLIAAAILLLLFATQMKTLFVPRGVKRATGIEQRPWLLEELLVPAGETIKAPRSPKPTLEASFVLGADVQRDGIERGTAEIAFEPDGRIRAVWETEYVSNENTHAITAEMSGNVSVKQTYEGPDGADKSRLFLIGKGTYQKTTTGADGDEEGVAWLVGWLRPDYSAVGHITLTTNRKWAAVYDWTTPGKDAQPE